MKRCQLCGTVEHDRGRHTCQACGEATWSPIDEQPEAPAVVDPKVEESADAPKTKRGRR